MKLNYFKVSLSVLFGVFFTFMSFAQKQEAIWSVNKNAEAQDVTFYKAKPKKSTVFSLNTEGLQSQLVNVPNRALSRTNSGVTMSFPNHKGELETFNVMEASNMDPELQAQFPEIRAYAGKSLTNPNATIRFSISPEKGFSGMVLSNEKTVFIEQYTADSYIAFINTEDDLETNTFVCEAEDTVAKMELSEEDMQALRNANDGTLRTYRLALACTVEYAQFHGGTLAGVMAAMNATMTRVNGIYERDLALTMVMVANNQNVIFLGPSTTSDPYTNNNGGAMLSQNQTTCDTNIGSGNYDIGHVFSTGGGGIASLNSPCTSTRKAQGVTGSPVPQGDAFDVDYVAHEMGHQFGATHTQNNNCQRTGSTSVEPGSASTIMGYAGICNPNVQNNSDDYFNGVSILQMWANISTGSGSSCFAGSATNNAAPVVNAGTDFSIPKSTAFVLRGTATDANTASGLTYCWEQIDTTPATMPPVSTSTAGPAFRSLDPSTSPNRYMPLLSTVMGGSLATTWEVVPTVGRTMNFLLTVRDNELNGGATNSDATVVTVQDVTPFTVNTPPTWGQNTTQQVNWVVGSTSGGVINCQSVNILFTRNNGATFTTLATGVPNTGSASITVPNVPDTNNARVLVEAADNIFYAVSNTFPISNTADFSVNLTSGDQAACDVDTATFTFDYVTSNGFSETTTFSVAGLPASASSSITPTTLSTDGTVTLNITGLNAVANNTYALTFTGTATSASKSTAANLTVTEGVCPSEGDLSYGTRTTGVEFNTINNASAGAKTAPYTDYTSQSTDVEAGMSYNLSVKANSDGNYQVITRAWIDWNQNCSFNDPGEEYELGTSANIADALTADSPLSITVPTDAVAGTTTMRVSTKYTDPGANQVPTACETGFDGEVEDYSLNVINNLSVDEVGLNNLSVYPNPNNGSFNVDFNPTSGEAIQIEVYDLRGRKVFTNTYTTTNRFNKEVNLNSAEAGVYMLVITEGSLKTVRKIIID